VALNTKIQSINRYIKRPILISKQLLFNNFDMTISEFQHRCIYKNPRCEANKTSILKQYARRVSGITFIRYHNSQKSVNLFEGK